MIKPKIAFYWCASCGGCEEAVVDLAEDILPVVEAVDIVMWPVAMDFKKSDIEKLKDNEIAVSFINGAIRTSEQEEMVKLLRKKSELVVAFGSCAHIGGIPGLGNFSNRREIFDYLYSKIPSVANPKKIKPQINIKYDDYKLELPKFYDTVKTLDQTVEVDYYLPGCAPPPDLIMDAINAILKGELPEKGAVLAPDKSLCDTCPRNDSKPEKLMMSEIKRPYEVEIDPKKCFLEEGIICLGPATRSGCGERCINANMACRGCFGPIDGVSDFGARSLSVIASILGVENEDNMTDEDIQKIADKILDPGGLFYMYSLPSSLLRRKIMP